MKKSNLVLGIVYVLSSVVCLLLEWIFKEKLAGTLIYFTVFFMISGIRMIREYVYWNSPENRERGQEIFENERIEEQDELKVKIKDKAARYTYTLGLYILSISIIVLGILGQFGVIEHAREIVLCLGGYFLIQVFAERIIFNHIMKKY